MGGKKGNKGSSDLGRSIMKDRFGKRNKPATSLLHTSELNDGQDWNRIDFNSVTEQTPVEEFLNTAELAGREFQAEKLNINFVRPTLTQGLLTEAEKKVVKEAQEKNKTLLRIPRRPPWDRTTSVEELMEYERNSFLEWRRSLIELEEVQGITLTPYERNLEFWRQLWRVIERSDVVVQIVDARNPLLFRCEDLEKYVKEVSPNKDNLLLVNKSDFLTESQRETWAQYFRERNIKAVFFSALDGEELDAIREEEEAILQEEEKRRLQEDESIPEDEDEDDGEGDSVDGNVEECSKDLENLNLHAEKEKTDDKISPEVHEDKKEDIPSTSEQSEFVTSSRLLSRSELIDVFTTIHKTQHILGKCVTIGLVGYPNVGKSSTINCLLKEKKVSVSATPGKTKHFQTLFLSNEVMLCDCPGLVFPAFVATKPEMIISGILPIDQMRDEVPPINLIANHIPRSVFENMYGINLPAPIEGEDPLRPPTSEELLNCYGFMRGFMTPRGIPDNSRAARYVLKDYVNGKLLYCHAPPGVPQADFHIHTLKKLEKTKTNVKLTPQQRSVQPYQVKPDALDQRFFGPTNVSQVHVIGVNKGGKPVLKSLGKAKDGEPRKKNFKKREKLRRVYAHLDQ
ncbi:large subunit GTPase 1 homolog [Palaemon carinicauda]|uniref:large subunit GTPase 1 homolog n=1 Tax=Palaemon carinicauda TaxID=392227 RepID=UPI0035B62BBC